MASKRKSFWDDLSNFLAIVFVLTLVLFIFIGPLLWAVHSLKRDVNPLHKYGAVLSSIAFLYIGGFVLNDGQRPVVAGLIVGLNSLAAITACYSLSKSS